MRQHTCHAMMSDTTVQMWIGWPFALYIAERLYGHFRAQTWDTKIVGACILDPGVLTLEISKPPGFSYK